LPGRAFLNLVFGNAKAAIDRHGLLGPKDAAAVGDQPSWASMFLDSSK
jgi:hypothetical protein